MSALPSHARVVIIGGGAVGASALYHLAKAGWTEVQSNQGASTDKQKDRNERTEQRKTLRTLIAKPKGGDDAGQNEEEWLQSSLRYP
mgnify:CR=1 FL=1